MANVYRDYIRSNGDYDIFIDQQAKEEVPF